MDLRALYLEVKTQLHQQDEDGPTMLQYAIRILLADRDQELEVGTASLVLTSLHYGLENDEENQYWMDNISVEARELHAVLLQHVQEVDSIGVFGFLLLHSLVIKPAYQNQGVASRILPLLLWHWREGSCPTHCFLVAQPLDAGRGRTEGRQRLKQLDAEGFCKQSERLRRFFSRLGFKRIARTPFMALNMGQDLPNLHPTLDDDSAPATLAAEDVRP